jgi:hypothetical protein
MSLDRMISEPRPELIPAVASLLLPETRHAQCKIQVLDKARGQFQLKL